MNYLQELNPQQREAVQHLEGPLMIIAGAGSGKTKVLTTRIAHLMHSGVDPFNILALTFTNKAAAEMKERIGHMLGGHESRNLYMGTFHSIFARVLRFEAEYLGYPKNFTIYDTDDAKNVLKQIIKAFQYDEKLYKASYVYNRISTAKNNLIGAAEYLEDKGIQQEDARQNRPNIGLIYKEYVSACFKNGAMDFDDILMNMYLLLRKYPEVLARYQHRFKYVMIDEYQDTNLAQYHIIKLLAAVNENICVVGDDAQSIYSFRGASMQNIFQFQKDYEDMHTIKLEQNYRCSKTILGAANSVINNNQNQIPKALWTDNIEGEKITVAQSLTDNDEGRQVADFIKEQMLRYHHPANDFAILYRTNAQSRSFEENLRRLNIDYRIYGGLSFYQRKEVKDIVAYLRSVVNPQDEQALRRIINLPARGIGNTTLQKIGIHAADNNITFWDALQLAETVGIKGTTLSQIQAFVILLTSMQKLLTTANAYDVTIRLGKESGLLQEFNADKTTEGIARMENVETLLNSIKEFTETPDEDGALEEKTLGNYLQQITLLTDADQDENTNNNVVKLMTIHAAKGLEFPCVFVVGMEENIFPSSMSLYDRDDLEEERRLFYVAITRAKQKLWITLAKNRYRFGSLVNNETSRFVSELPDHLVKKQLISTPSASTSSRPQWGNKGDAFGYKSNNASSAKNDNSNATQQKKVVINNTPSTHIPSANFAPSAPADIKTGMRVEHQKFGYGTVEAIEGSALDLKAKIKFDTEASAKTMMLNFAKLRIDQA